jgi:hypothetical protein
MDNHNILKKTTLIISTLFIATILLTSFLVMGPVYGQGQGQGRGPPATTGPPCPAGSEFVVEDGVGRCVSDQPPQPCPPPSDVNPATGLCEAPPIERCLAPTEYNPATGKCEDEIPPIQCQLPFVPSSDGSQCILPSTINSCPPLTRFQSGTCVSSERPICPPSFNLQGEGCVSNFRIQNENQAAACRAIGGHVEEVGAENKCVVEPRCTVPGTAYNPTTNRCEAPPQCPVGSPNPQTGICEAPPIDRCPVGDFNPVTKQCVVPTEPAQCLPPYQVSNDGSQCVFPPFNPCPAGSKLDPNTNQCIYNPNRCPQGFDPAPTGDRCIQKNRNNNI